MRQAENSVESLHSQLNTNQATVDSDSLSLLNLAKRFRTDVTDSFDGSLFKFIRKAGK